MKPAPLQLDTSRADWKRQFRGITRCKGPTCKAEIGWVIIDEGTWERRVPYNTKDGKLHHSTCPDVEFFKAQRVGRSTAPAAKPEDKPEPKQPALFSGDGKYPD